MSVVARRRLRTAAVTAWITMAVVGLPLGASAALDLRDALADPATACLDELPWFEGFQVVEWHRHWPPPVLRCSYVDEDLGQGGPARSVTAVPTSEIAIGATALVVGVYASGSGAWALLLRRRGRRRKSVEFLAMIDNH